MTNPFRTAYPFCEIFRATTTGATAVNVWAIPAGTVVERVYARIVTAGVGTGDVDVGDADQSDDYLDGCSATAAADTFYGDDPTENGPYLYDATKKSLNAKHYAAGNTLKLVSAATLTTEATVDIIVSGFRYSRA